ncbi:MAG: 50S ribosomal protein L29 [Nitrospirae bacterium]|jgi:large subunit ribosomal protein L29|nr:50S ribosomal protein L29 [Nitrospirota bacterium]MCL5062061.1 50S ribosomal protein L29 [Nitrospirota bacterium]MDA8213868.1 50S ribosomal protein L29 [Nitrospiraceae bacterium]MDA8338543.1 50S ribosomal protein L29 [Nitrospiraceae bacterium]
MKPSEIKALSVEELKQKEMDLRRELFNLRFQLSKGEQANNMRVRAVRKDIARVLTIITQKQKGV